MSVSAKSASRLRVLLIVEQCNPDGVSVPLVGYSFYQAIAQQAEVTLVTHGRNQAALERLHPRQDIVYVFESAWLRRYYQLIARLSSFRGRVIWPLRLALAYPIYHAFNQQVYARFGTQIEQGRYDIVHAITPMMPRYPVKAVRACHQASAPFVIGPVNGGVPYPKGFKSVARREFAGLNFLRWIGRRLIPGYRETYEQADYVLVGSRYTAALLTRLFGLGSERMALFSENGLQRGFLQRPAAGNERKALGLDTRIEASVVAESVGQTTAEQGDHQRVRLLFVGRLVPYKSADMVIEALALLPVDVLRRVELTIVGAGPEERALRRQVTKLRLTEQVRFAGWVAHAQTLEYYRAADVFCFPSVREFGGAVVLEAMANRLPCVVVDHGGIGEYVTEKTGFKIEPISRQFVVEQLAEKLALLVRSPTLRKEMSKQALLRAAAFTWENKAQRLLEIYQRLLDKKRHKEHELSHHYSTVEP